MSYMEKAIWPENKKCAAMITVNLSAELFWLDLDPTCVNMPKTLSMGQYGMTNGLERILDLLDDKNIKATFFVPGKIAELYPEKIKELTTRGHEVAGSSYEQENLALLDREEQKASIDKSIKIIENICGKKPKGFRNPQGEITLETLDLAKKLGMEYSSNLSDDDRPYNREVSQGNNLLEIPIHWVMYDLPYFAFNYRPAFPAGQNRIANYTGVLANWKEEFSGYYDLGLCYVLQVDPQTIGSPGRIQIFEEILDFICEHDNVWMPTGLEMANYMKELKK